MVRAGRLYHARVTPCPPCIPSWNWAIVALVSLRVMVKIMDGGGGGGLMFQHGGAPLHACISLSERVKASEH